MKTEQNITSWKEVARQILNALYETDKDIFVKAASNWLSSNDKDFRIPLQIADNLYFESNASTETLLNMSKTIVENFERISGTNFKDEIWFTLQIKDS